MPPNRTTVYVLYIRSTDGNLDSQHEYEGRLRSTHRTSPSCLISWMQGVCWLETNVNLNGRHDQPRSIWKRHHNSDRTRACARPLARREGLKRATVRCNRSSISHGSPSTRTRRRKEVYLAKPPQPSGLPRWNPST